MASVLQFWPKEVAVHRQEEMQSLLAFEDSLDVLSGYLNSHWKKSAVMSDGATHLP